MARREPKPAAGVPAPDAPTPPEQLSFEEAVAELEGIIDRIEEGAIGLEESLRQFGRGNALVRRCRTILDAAEQQVREIAVTDVAETGGAGDGPAE